MTDTQDTFIFLGCILGVAMLASKGLRQFVVGYAMLCLAGMAVLAVVGGVIFLATGGHGLPSGNGENPWAEGNWRD